MEKPYSLDDYVSWVKEYIKENDLVRPSVVAHSFGGRIALKLAFNYPDLIDKVVLVGSAGLRPKKTLKKRIKSVAFKTLKLFIPKEKLSRFYSSDYRAISPVMKQSFIKIVNEHLDYTLEKIVNPTLIVFGEKDKETPVYMAKRLNKGIKNSRLIILRDAGHFCFIEKTHAFNTEVREFLLS